MASGTKRPYERDDPRARDREDEGKRSKPKDWRDAFLDDEPRRSHGGGERERERYSSRSDRERYSREGSGSSRDRAVRDRDREQGGHHHRERDKGESSRRYGDTRDQRRDRDRDSDRGHSHGHGHGNDRYGNGSRDARAPNHAQGLPYPDREEGEIETSPAKPVSTLPAATSSGPHVSPRTDRNAPPTGPPPRGFQGISIPTGPKSRNVQTRPPPSGPSGSTSSFFDASTSVNKNGAGDSKTEEIEEIPMEEEKDPETLLEERRRKRAEIMAKFQAQGRKEKPIESSVASPAPETMGTGADSVNSGGIRTGATSLLKQLGTRSTSLMPASSDTPTNLREPSLAPTPQGHDFDLTKAAGTANDATVPSASKDDGAGADAMVSAADYDPTQDMKNDREKRIKDAEGTHADPEAVADGVGEPIAPPVKQQEEWEEVEIEVDDEDEELDMFAAFEDEGQAKKKKKITVRRLKAGGINGDNKQEIVKRSNKAAALQVVDNVDDTDGYYRITPGEILDDGRYQVTITLGKGMFSAVVKAKVLKAVDRERRQDVVGKEVAIKVIRSQESMYVAGRKEATILQKLNEADPEDKKHIVRMERIFEHRGHLCIVTESLSMNLRDVIKRFGKDVGLNMRAVRAYAHQMFLALSLLRKTNIVHADIKPDNILVTENKATLKVCDLGSASDVKDGEITPYLVSRFYRAPEIILGLPYDTAIDVWSMGCTLYELYTGKILFPGRSNNHMLLLMMEVKGKLNHRMIKKATLGEMHFDEQLNFISIEQDKITRQDVAKTLNISKATRDLRSRLLPPSAVQLKMKEDELKQLQHFIDLLDKCLQLDPARRLTPRDALLHPFLTGQA